jgi:hypothetical protein
MDLEVISKSGTAVVAHHRSKTPEPGAPYPVKPLDCSWFRMAPSFVAVAESMVLS